jgi:carbonic anhydrase/acetyltransferase-like protein (isoleucine patch superfamily)
MIIDLPNRSPRIADDCFVAPNATVIGDTTMESGASVWFGTVVRADVERVHIGANTNVQDNAVIHADPGSPVILGKGITIGHKAMVHGCTVGDHSLIGINAVVLNGAKIGKHCLIGANSLVPEGMEIPDYSLVVGSPAKIKRQLSEKEVTALVEGSGHYCENAADYRSNMVVRRL